MFGKRKIQGFVSDEMQLQLLVWRNWKNIGGSAVVL
jgi:hypothetical protein